MTAAHRPLAANHSILIVDQSADAREVLRTVLERRGLTIFEAEDADNGLSLAEQHHPQVIVFDRDEAGAVGGDRVEAQFRRCSREHGGALVVLASARRTSPVNEGASVVRKPYHYGPLIRKIEALVERAD